MSDWTAWMASRRFAGPTRFVAGVLVLLVTALLAMQAQYLGGSDTFGSSPLWDYIALVVAGFTGAVTQKALVSAKPAKA